MDGIGEWLIIATAATAASWLGSTAGSGGTTILLPVLVAFLGVKEALPVLTLCNFTANGSRAWINRAEIDRRLVVWFVLGGIPFIILGAYLFTRTPAGLLLKALGAFLVFMVVWRFLARRRRRGTWRIRNPRTFGPLGAFFGFLYGFTEGIGPLMAPFFLAYGLVRGAYIGTDALGTFTLQATKLLAFGQLDVFSAKLLVYGLSLAPFMILGTWLGKKTVDRISAVWFTRIVELTVLVAGLTFLLG